MGDAHVVVGKGLSYFVAMANEKRVNQLYEHVMQVATQRQLDLINKANEED